MTDELRLALHKLVFLITERGLKERYCSCRKPIDSLVTAAIREAIDKVEELIAREPHTNRFTYLEVDKDGKG